MNKPLATATVLALFVACTLTGEKKVEQSSEDSTQEPGPQEADKKSSSESGQARDDLRSQFDLAAAIRHIEKVQDDDERAFALADLSESWQGARYRWTVNFLSAFCPNAEGCHVVPFERGGKDKDIVQGWVPQLEISDAQWEKLAQACAQRQSRCRVTFAGTLANFRISTEELTRLTFTDVSLLAVGDTAL